MSAMPRGVSKKVTGGDIPNSDRPVSKASHATTFPTAAVNSSSTYSSSISPTPQPAQPTSDILDGHKRERTVLDTDLTPNIPGFSSATSTSTPTLNNYNNAISPETPASLLLDEDSKNNKAPKHLPISNALVEGILSTTTTIAPTTESKIDVVSNHLCGDYSTKTAKDVSALGSKAASAPIVPAGWKMSSEGVLEQDEGYELEDEEDIEDAAVEDARGAIDAAWTGAVSDVDHELDEPAKDEPVAVVESEGAPARSAMADDSEASAADVLENAICLKGICRASSVHPAADCPFFYQALSPAQIEERRVQRAKLLATSNVRDLALLDDHLVPFPTVVRCWRCTAFTHKSDDCLFPPPPPVPLAPGERTQLLEDAASATPPTTRRRRNKANKKTAHQSKRDLSYFRQKRNSLRSDPPTFPSSVVPTVPTPTSHTLATSSVTAVQNPTLMFPYPPGQAFAGSSGGAGPSTFAFHPFYGYYPSSGYYPYGYPPPPYGYPPHF